MHAASLNAVEAISATATAAARAARAESEEKKADAAAIVGDNAMNDAILWDRVQVAERDVREQKEKRAVQLVRYLLY